jgi:hypothetical protein
MLNVPLAVGAGVHSLGKDVHQFMFKVLPARPATAR